jgi:hypothetical protein
MTRSIDYGTLMHRALRGLIHEVLSDIAENGLPGAHHFFVTFDTRHPKARVPDSLRARYPEEMMIVLQHEFFDLSTDGDGFSVKLSFGDRPEPLYIPYDAIRTFVDPSVEFGLRFETHSSEDDDDEDDDEDEDPKDAEIVSLDSWRK